MTIQYFPELTQGSDEWLAARCGLLTASEMHLIITLSLKIASNEKERAHLYELAAQRVTGYVEPRYIGDDMLRGQVDEIAARELYAEHYAPVQAMGFVTNDEWGFTLGCSPDGLVGEVGMIECKSRRQKFQFRAIADLTVDPDFVIQLQTGLLVTRRQWNDHITYCGGMSMLTLRVYPDPIVQNAIIEAAGAFEKRLEEKIQQYAASLKSKARLIPTERQIVQEMFV